MRKILTRMLSVFTACICLFAVSAFSFNGSQITANAADQQINGITDDYVYEMWNAFYEGDVAYENIENNGFSVNWNDIFNFTALKGKGFEKSTVNAYQLKDYSIDYSLDITTDGIAYAGVQGWMSNPLVKFHIVEAWTSWQPPGEDVKNLGSVTIGDTTYDLFWNLHIGMTMDGSGCNYPMYWSVARRDPLELNTTNHIKGTIDIVEHFKAWASAGLDLGYIYDVKFGVEAYKSNGSAKLISMDTNMDTAAEELSAKFRCEPYEAHDPLPIGKDGKIITVDFETENDKAGCYYNENTADLTKDAFFSGERSMYVRCGKYGLSSFCYELDPYDLPSNDDGSAVRFQTGARIYADKDVSFDVYLVEYNDEEIIPQEREIFVGRKMCKAGQWTDFRGLFFDFLHDKCKKYKIVFAAADTNVDFFIDDFFIGSVDSAEETTIQTFEAEKRGDINCDGVTDVFDLIPLRKAILEIIANNVSAPANSDVNSDGTVNVADLVCLQRFILGAEKLTNSETTTVVSFTDTSAAMTAS